MTKLANINNKDLMSIFKCAPDGATHYVDFNPGCYKNKTYATSTKSMMKLFKSANEMMEVEIKTNEPVAYSLAEISEELKARVIAKVDSL